MTTAQNKKTVLITGAASFIGSHVMRDFAAAGWNVVAAVRNHSIHFPEGTDIDGIEVVRGDLSDPAFYEQERTDLDAIVHLAAQSPSGTCSVEDLITSNATATALVADYASRCGVRRVVYASSISIHGNIAENEVTPTTPITNPSPYGMTKYLGELLLKQRHLRGDFDVAAIRLPAVLGRRASRHLFANLLSRVKAGQPIEIYNPDAPFNNAIHVDDLGGLIRSAVTHGWTGFHAFPVGSAGELTIQRTAELLIECCSSTSTISVVEAPNSAFKISTRYAQENFGHTATDFTTVLRRYILDNDSIS